MRLAVIGAGAVGGTIAALLARAGHEVQFVARGEQLAAVAEHGLTLTGPWGDFTVRVDAVERLTGTFDLAVLATKAQDAPGALAANSPLLAGTAIITGVPVLVVQNGLEAITAAKAVAPRSQIVGGLALYAASYLNPGTITVTATGSTILGGSQEATRFVSQVLGAVMPVQITENFLGAQWAKLLINHVNGLSAVTGLSVQEVIGDRQLRAIMTESMREAVRVAKAQKIQFAKVQGITGQMLGALESWPGAFGQLLPLALKRRMGSQPNPGSTLQSIRRGKPTEIDYLNGAMVRLGALSSVATPVSAKIVELVHEVELSGQFIAPATVVQRMRRAARA